MKLYPINITKLGISLLPTQLRTASVAEFIRVMLFPLQSIQNAFFANRDRNNYLLTHNGQVCRLRKVLNEAFPTRSKSFLIEDAVDYGTWQYARDEDDLYNQLMIPDEGGVIIWDEETMTKYADFIVLIPADVAGVDNMNMIRALVNTYKLASKKAIYELY